MYTQDDLYLLVDFLEEKLENERETDYVGYYVGYSEEELEEFAVSETMYEMSIEVIKSLIKE